MRKIGLAVWLLFLSLLLASCAPALPAFQPFETKDESDSAESETGSEQEKIPTLTLDRRRYSFTGREDAIRVKDDLLTLGQAGSYRLTGSLTEGGIAVDVGWDGVVRLILDGVSLSSTGRPVLQVLSAAAVILESKDGSVNLLHSTAGTAVSSEGNLLLTGTGSLSVSGAPIALSSAGRLTVESGTVRITASECGIRADTGIEILGGEIAINAARVGLMSEERVNSSGGIVIRGGFLTAVCAETVLSARTRILLTGGVGSFDAPRFYQCQYTENGALVKGSVLQTGGNFPPL